MASILMTTSQNVFAACSYVSSKNENFGNEREVENGMYPYYSKICTDSNGLTTETKYEASSYLEGDYGSFVKTISTTTNSENNVVSKEEWKYILDSGEPAPLGSGLPGQTYLSGNFSIIHSQNNSLVSKEEYGYNRLKLKETYESGQLVSKEEWNYDSEDYSVYTKTTSDGKVVYKQDNTDCSGSLYDCGVWETYDTKGNLISQRCVMAVYDDDPSSAYADYCDMNGIQNNYTDKLFQNDYQSEVERKIENTYDENGNLLYTEEFLYVDGQEITDHYKKTVNESSNSESKPVKRIYTIDEATKLSKPTGNTFKLRYK